MPYSETHQGINSKVEGPSSQTKSWVSGLSLAVADGFSMLSCFLLGVWGLTFYGHYVGDPTAWNTWIATTGIPHFFVDIFFIFITIFVLWFSGLYHKRLPFWDELGQILRYLIFICMMHGAVVLAAKWPFSKFVWMVSWMGSMVLVPVMRSLTKKLLHSLGYWEIPTVILGAGQNALAAYRALKSEPAMGFKVLGFITLNGQQELPAPVTQVAKENLFPTLQAMQFPHVIFAIEQLDLYKHQDIIQTMTLKYPSFSWIPDVAGLPILGMETNHFFSHEVLILNVKNNLSNPLARTLKRWMDVLGSSFLLLSLSPLFAYLAWQISKTKGPIFFAHDRIGQDRKKFRCWKFRTMVPDAGILLEKLLLTDPVAKAQWETEFKLKNDPRITKVGHFLRRSSLDELPQLWNVLIGDMSLVGPRPIISEELKMYESKLDYYLAARPGITGLWQVSGRNDLSYSARTDLDAWYVKNWNIWYDIAILFKTVHVVFGKKGAY